MQWGGSAASHKSWDFTALSWNSALADEDSAGVTFSIVSSFPLKSQVMIHPRGKESLAKRQRMEGFVVFVCNCGQETVPALIFSSSLLITSTMHRQWKRNSL